MARSASPPVVGYLRHGPLPAATVVALLDALGQHSPTSEPDPPEGCWLDLRVGARGPDPRARARATLATARAWGCPSPRVGVAPTPGVARLATRHGAGEVVALDSDTVAPFLAPLPTAALGLDADTATRLALVGLHTCGDIAALPRGSLGDYLGGDGLALDALARGEDARPLAPRRPPLVLTARRDLDWALAERGALARLVRHLLAPLAAHLRHLGLGATRATLRLTDGAGVRRETVARLAAPTADLDAIVRPLLAALPPCAGGDDEREESMGIAAVAVALAAPRPPTARQSSFFDVPTGRRALAALGVAEARRRGQGQLGYLRLGDAAHPLPEGRYTLDEAAPDARDGWAAS